MNERCARTFLYIGTVMSPVDPFLACWQAIFFLLYFISIQARSLFFSFFLHPTYFPCFSSSFHPTPTLALPFMSPFSSKLSRVRSVKLSAFGHRQSQRVPSPNPPQQRQQQQHYRQPPGSTPSLRIPEQDHNTSSSLPRSRSCGTTNSFGETLKAISKEAESGEFADVFDSFFFNDKRCRNRALFMTARMKQALQSDISPQPVFSMSTPTTSSMHSSYHQPAAVDCRRETVWDLIAHRLYTLNYLLFVLPSVSETRARFLASLESQLAQIGDGQHVYRRGGMEAHFAVRYVLKNRRRSLGMADYDDDEIEELVEKARKTLEHCLESEAKLGHSERDAMYAFHGMRMGLLNTIEPRIELDEDYVLAQQLARAVEENKQMSKPAYVNPFEDDDAVVIEDDDDDNNNNNNEYLAPPPPPPSRTQQVDSGFYDQYAAPTVS